MSRFKELGDTSSPTVKHVKEEDLFEGDIKLTPKQKAALQSDHKATVQNWRITADKCQRDGIPYFLNSRLCRLPYK